MKGRTRRPFNVRCAKGATSRKNETNVDLSCGWNRRSSSPRLPIAHTAADEFAALHGNGHQGDPATNRWTADPHPGTLSMFCLFVESG